MLHSSIHNHLFSKVSNVDGSLGRMSAYFGRVVVLGFSSEAFRHNHMSLTDKNARDRVVV